MAVGFAAGFGAACAVPGARPTASAAAIASVPAADTNRVIDPRTIVRPPRPVVDMASHTADRAVMVESRRGLGFQPSRTHVRTHLSPDELKPSGDDR